MSAFVTLTLTFSGTLLSVMDSVNLLKRAGWHLVREGRITFLVDRTDDYTWQYASPEAENETLKLLDHELASGAKVGILLHSAENEDYRVYATFTDPLSITAVITADRKVLDIGSGQELTDIGWYIQHLVRPFCADQFAAQLVSLNWSERP